MDRTKTTEVARKAAGPRTPYVFGDKVLHNGATWTVIEDRGKNITPRLEGQAHFKVVLPEDVQPAPDKR